MGLTWIDYETIDKPIEEITQGTGEADEIEFHVETLSNVKETGDGKDFGGSNNLGKPSKKDSLGGIKVKFFIKCNYITYIKKNLTYSKKNQNFL